METIRAGENGMIWYGHGIITYIGESEIKNTVREDLAEDLVQRTWI